MPPLGVNHLAEQALCSRSRSQCGDLGAAAGLSQNGHIVGVAAEGCNVIAHPLQGQHHIGYADIRIAANGGQIQKTNVVQAHIDRNEHAVGVVGKVAAIIGFQFQRRAIQQAAAVHEHQNGLLCTAVQRGGPDIQVQALALLTEDIRFGRSEECSPCKNVGVFCAGVALGRNGAVGQSLGRELLRAVFFNGRGVLEPLVYTVRNAAEHMDAIMVVTHDIAARQTDYGRNRDLGVSQGLNSSFEAVLILGLGRSCCACSQRHGTGQCCGSTGQGRRAQKITTRELFHDRVSFFHLNLRCTVFVHLTQIL